MLQFNVSIARHEDRIWCSYQTRHLRHYHAGCFLAELSPDLELISEKPLFVENRNTAFEKVRLFSYSDRLLAFYNYLPFNENSGWGSKFEVGFGELDGDTGIITNQRSLKKFGKGGHEKNWVPYVYDQELYMITDLDPYLRVIKTGDTAANPDLTNIYLSPQPTGGWKFGQLRGGTPLLNSPYFEKHIYFGFVHSFLPEQEGYTRCYYYTIIRYNHLNKSFNYHPLPLDYTVEEPDEEHIALWNHSNGGRRKVIYPMGISSQDDGVLVSFSKDEVVGFTEYFSWKRIAEYFA